MKRWKAHLSAFLSAAIVVSSVCGFGLMSADRAEAAVPQNVKFDFGSESSPVAAGYSKVSNTTLYTASRGYGLDKTVDFRDRGGGDPLLGDFVISSSFSFMVDLPNGDYSVKVTAGDLIASNKTDVKIEGVSYGTLSSSTGNFSSLTKTIRLIDGQMTFQFSNNGRVNAIEIAPANAPTGLTVTAMTYLPAASVSLVWDAVYGAAGYNLYRTGDNDNDFAKIGSVAGTSYIDAGVALAGTYQYKITQLTAEQLESVASAPITVSVKDASVPVPAAPTGLSLKGISKEQLTIGWEPVPGASLYYIYRAKSLDGPYVKAGSSAGNEYTDTQVFTTVPYFYKVAAVGPGGLSAPSDVLNVPAATVLYRQAETLDRSPVAVKVDGGVYIGWRLFGTDPANIAFQLYRDGKLISSAPITAVTNYLDAEGTADSLYEVRAVTGGAEEPGTKPFGVWNQNYLDVPLQKPQEGVAQDGTAYTYSANDTSIGDLDGDGKYELIVKWDPSNSRDNSQSGYTGNVYLDAYKLDGSLLWRIDLGRNIRAGAHYTQFMVFDLDGDGKAEVMFKTADGTIDGSGVAIGDPSKDYRNSSGYILSGPEYLTVFEGATGKALATTNYDPPRGKVADWGDTYGNRVDRFLAGVAYLDGERPSVIFARGYYTRTVLAAYNWRNGQLSQLWKFDSDNPGYGEYTGQGNHQLSIADVDGDGKDEIIYGAMALDDDGTPLFNTRFGHGDALHVGDLDPSRPGLEVFKVDEHTDSPYGAVVFDAQSGKALWGLSTGQDTGRGMSADIDPRYKGEEVWASNGVGLNSVRGEKIGSSTPSINFGIWWDGDLLRELLDHTYNSSIAAGVGKIDKWDYINNKPVRILTATGTYSNNTTKGTPNLQADLFGDWREEAVWRTEDSSALRIYTTTDKTDHRLYTLMDDSQYRLAVAWQNVGYNQPPHPSFFLGDGMDAPQLPKLKRIPIPMTAIDLSGTATEVAAGSDLAVSAVVAPAAATNKSLRWSVTAEDGSATDLAVVDARGVLHAKTPGKVKVTAAAMDGSGVSGGAMVTIKPVLVTAIDVKGTAQAEWLPVGGTLQMNADIAPSSASDRSVAWSVSPADDTSTVAAIIDANGVLRGLAEGAVKVIAAARDGSGVTGSIVMQVVASKVNGGTIDRYVIPDGQGRVTADIKLSDLEQAAAGSGTHAIEINVHSAPAAVSVQANIPASFVFDAEKRAASRIGIRTEIAQIAIDPDLFKRQNIDHGAASVQVKIALANISLLSHREKQEIQGHPVYEFGLSFDGREVSGFGNDVRVTVPYVLKDGEDPKKIVIYVLDDNGKVRALKNGVYDAATGTVAFQPGNF
ncbi:Ig-like domain-containing protein [Paenibacillus allorhizosphaerae]|uniref:rhamnogalacturonan lyase family protein n=1 Tax=Paenibacillus allorhizosphaerae TaxID=2849866 RepID=UPI002E7910F7|nr:Ig-like domain-containing protein [Paenibacillus allorhizosphaerae]